MLDEVTACFDPCPNSPGIEGHGEGVEYRSGHYYYRVGKRIPKNKVVPLRCEDNYCGRVHGEVEYLIVAWNGKSFSVLENPRSGELQQRMILYREATPQQAIARKMAQLEERQRRLDAQPKCKCGELLLVLDEQQRPDECLGCMKKRLGLR